MRQKHLDGNNKKLSSMKTSYIFLSVFIYISAVLSFIGVVFGMIFLYPFIVLMNILGYYLVYKKYRCYPELHVQDNMNDVVMLYLCKTAGCYLISSLLCFCFRDSMSIDNLEKMRNTIIGFMIVIFLITPSVKKGVRNMQDKYMYRMVNRKNAISLVEEDCISKNESYIQKSRFRVLDILNKMKTNYSIVNTILPILIVVSLYILPIGEDYYIYECIGDEYYEGVIYTLLVLPFIMVILNWTYKVFQMRIQLVYVINILLYAFIIIAFLVFFAKYKFVFLMLIPILMSLCAILLSKSLIDESTKKQNERSNQSKTDVENQ